MTEAITLDQLQQRKDHLIKGRDNLTANVHIMNGAIAEIERLIGLIGEESCAIQEKVESPVKLEKVEVKKEAERKSNGGAKGN